MSWNNGVDKQQHQQQLFQRDVNAKLTCFVVVNLSKHSNRKLYEYGTNTNLSKTPFLELDGSILELVISLIIPKQGVTP